MKLGLLADIHEEDELLRRCVDLLDAQGVDRFVILGDIADHGRNLASTVRILSELDSVGVWGNHDFGLCGAPSSDVRSRFGPEILAYFASLLPRVEIEECLCQHIEHHRDPGDLLDLWSGGGTGAIDPDACFRATHQRRLFMGHLHRWEVRTPGGIVGWRGEGPIALTKQERSFVVVHGVQQGWCARFDTEDGLLEPYQVR